ncbi:D-lactate dehydrogenase (cytochrome) [Deinobacterium chartae]|uniref:D-lactate dehydrogenase (cytochrome) n=1 Tax=Deinobacterium chartae TaxID=521158 RepID=A0A841I1P6_9DEIO|nr:FAD-binding oxidoreductase [Deinobacterium chartae]MBB6098319.1 D-lactate dehydrogenase (cytochrome) [Deinobacterium chartae]
MNPPVPSSRAVTRPPRGEARTRPSQDPDLIASVLEDAAHFPGGHAQAVAYPLSEADVSALLRDTAAVLPTGAQSSLTGGATPRGGLVLSLARMNRILEISGNRVRVEAGVPLSVLAETLAEQNLYYPPVPTYPGALVGGVIATNAAGAATFKYGTTRNWVESITVVLASGEVIDLERGQVQAHPDGCFEIEGAQGITRVPVPPYRMPDVPKLSAGYYAAPGMDLIDLFIGAEGTLGVITEATLRLVSPAPTLAGLWLNFPSEVRGLEVVSRLREISQATWASRDPNGIDVAAIEMVDARCLTILREDGADRRLNVNLAGAQFAVLAQVELPPLSLDEAYEQLAEALEDEALDTPLARLVRFLAEQDLLESAEFALPGDTRRLAQLFALREAVPEGVNARIKAAQRQHPGVSKAAADMIVPFERFAEALELYRRGFERRGLDYAVWGHVSDGNVHPNALPRTEAEYRLAQEAILEFGLEVARLGGSPLAEHGVGKNPTKQALLRGLYGDAGLEAMRAVKQALDPGWKLAPGNLFAQV